MGSWRHLCAFMILCDRWYDWETIIVRADTLCPMNLIWCSIPIIAESLLYEVLVFRRGVIVAEKIRFAPEIVSGVIGRTISQILCMFLDIIVEHDFNPLDAGTFLPGVEGCCDAWWIGMKGPMQPWCQGVIWRFLSLDVVDGVAVQLRRCFRYSNQIDTGEAVCAYVDRWLSWELFEVGNMNCHEICLRIKHEICLRIKQPISWHYTRRNEKGCSVWKLVGMYHFWIDKRGWEKINEGGKNLICHDVHGIVGAQMGRREHKQECVWHWFDQEK